jgi:single-stranded DNA-binding protein
MNKAYLTVNVTAAPQQVYISESRTIVECSVEIPTNNPRNAATKLTYKIWANQEKFLSAISAGMQLYISGAQLRHDLKERSYSLHDGNWVIVPTGQFPLLNEIILSGRCIKDVDLSDPRQFKTTDSGYIISSQSLSVNRGKQETDLFNLKAITKADSKVRYAEWLANMTRKGTGLTVAGRISTSEWKDQTTQELRSNTEIQISQMTLAPKPKTNEIQPQATMSNDSEAKSLWSAPVAAGVAEPWGSNTEGLPDLPATDNMPF